MNTPEILTHIKAYRKKKGISKADIWTDNDLLEFSLYMFQKETERIDKFIHDSVSGHKKESEENVKKIMIGQVWMEIESGRKMLVDFETMLKIKEGPEDYQYICRYPHEDNDYTYTCKNPYCKCKPKLEYGNIVQ
jgi:hypothetical protein